MRRGSITWWKQVSLVQRDITEFLTEVEKGDYRYQSNISTLERQVLKSLKKMKDIIIKPVDKGGANVVMDNTDCIEEIMSQLSVKEIYVCLTQDPTHTLSQYLRNTVQQYLAKRRDCL